MLNVATSADHLPVPFFLSHNLSETFGLNASEVALRRPMHESPDPQWLPDDPPLLVFPSAHDPALDGRIELLCITLT